MTQKDINVKEKFWELYKKLPQELKDAIFAEETGNNIYDICKRNEVKNKLGQIVDAVGYVLLGLLPPEKFQETLEKEMNIATETAKSINHEINRLIFFPVKTSLATFYGKSITEPVQMPTKSELGTTVIKENLLEEKKPTSEEAPQLEKKEASKTADNYREPID